MKFSVLSSPTIIVTSTPKMHNKDELMKLIFQVVFYRVNILFLHGVISSVFPCKSFSYEKISHDLNGEPFLLISLVILVYPALYLNNFVEG